MSGLTIMILLVVAALGLYTIFTRFDFIDIFSVVFVFLSLFVLSVWTLNIMAGAKNG